MKKSFFILELIIILIIFSIIYSTIYIKDSTYKFNLFVSKIELYLNFLRYKALIDDKTDLENSIWHKQRWTMKFLRCRENEGGGVYISIYTDNNTLGHTNKEEALKDPLTNRYITNSNFCKDDDKYSSFTLLRNYNVKSVDISCNSTTSLGQISFGEDGRVYSRLSNVDNETYEYEITKPCFIKVTSDNNYEKEIIIYPKTGFINRF
ncbi:type II secretion system protein [Aliarcobacter skirrowii]|uniref:type II secretion system protein n=1 Tax=Aliarcobacter skirrowii TaxID=28200 RepID=UPI0029B86C7B|nr:type II secretion system protein [Aliarcobacter skirrowii]MDX4065897.1 type II secretion system protein [Aliarcobacter skirrowii]